MTDLQTRLQRESTPLIEGNQATFVWLGPMAPQLKGDMSGWGRAPLILEPVQPGVWTRTVTLPDDAYVEYIYMLGGEGIGDPFNPRRVTSGIGSTNNYFYMPKAHYRDWDVKRDEVPQGQVLSATLSSELLTDGKRRVRLYHPAAAGPFPLLVVFDGNDYITHVHLPTMADNLIAQGQIQPLAIAMLDNHPKARIAEYACSEATLTFVIEELLPWVRDYVPLVTTPGAHALAGASLGGLMSLWAALRHPDVFGHVLSQSGAFWMTAYGNTLMQALEPSAANPLRIYQSVGTLESLLQINRSVSELLKSKGHGLRYSEFNAGHNYVAWRNDFPQGLTWLYGH